MENKHKILIVDDEVINHYLIKTLLSGVDFIFSDSYNGKDAIEKVKNNKFDLILMDIRMPEIDGIEAANKIKETNPNIPIISISAYVNDYSGLSIFDDIIGKPIFRDVLINKINKFLK